MPITLLVLPLVQAFLRFGFGRVVALPWPLPLVRFFYGERQQV